MRVNPPYDPGRRMSVLDPTKPEPRPDGILAVECANAADDARRINVEPVDTTNAEVSQDGESSSGHHVIGSGAAAPRSGRGRTSVGFPPDLSRALAFSYSAVIADGQQRFRDDARG
jgi:hypothetical protein